MGMDLPGGKVEIYRELHRQRGDKSPFRVPLVFGNYRSGLGIYPQNNIHPKYLLIMRSTTSSKILALVALVAANLTLLPLAAQANTAFPISSNFQTNSGSTQLLFNSNPGNRNPRQGVAIEYQTKVQGEIWWGRLSNGVMSMKNGKTTISGTFRDAPSTSYFNPNSPVVCAGDLEAIQSFANNRFSLTAQWKVTGGKNCASIGQTINLSLSEAIPMADAQGDYNYANSRVWYGLESGQNDYHTWDRWRAIESGSLNCRERPNGKILRSYAQGSDFIARYDGRGTASAILGADNTQTNPSTMNPNTVKGKPWLLTKDNCFVRSNSQYIQPQSFSQQFNP
jgi:hypothetical protein